jgi:uncharacterized membrane protein
MSKQSRAVSSRSQHVALSSSFVGPIPPPEMLSKYNQVCPDAANRILKMAEEQSVHRRKIESCVINARSRDSLLGIIFGLLIGIFALLIGAYVIIKGFPWAGSLISSSGLAGLVGVFIYGTRESRQERDSKARQSMQ